MLQPEAGLQEGSNGWDTVQLVRDLVSRHSGLAPSDVARAAELVLLGQTRHEIYDDFLRNPDPLLRVVADKVRAIRDAPGDDDEALWRELGLAAPTTHAAAGCARDGGRLPDQDAVYASIARNNKLDDIGVCRRGEPFRPWLGAEHFARALGGSADARPYYAINLRVDDFLAVPGAVAGRCAYSEEPTTANLAPEGNVVDSHIGA